MIVVMMPMMMTMTIVVVMIIVVCGGADNVIGDYGGEANDLQHRRFIINFCDASHGYRAVCFDL